MIPQEQWRLAVLYASDFPRVEAFGDAMLQHENLFSDSFYGRPIDQTTVATFSEMQALLLRATMSEDDWKEEFQWAWTGGDSTKTFYIPPSRAKRLAASNAMMDPVLRTQARLDFRQLNGSYQVDKP